MFGLAGKRAVIALFFIGLCTTLLPPSALAKAHHKASHRHHSSRHRHYSLVNSDAGYADIVMNAETGEILHATNPDSLRHPASLTKMMTLYLTFQALEAHRVGPNQYIPVSVNASEQAPSKLGLRPGNKIRVEDAIYGVVTESANDAAVALAEWLGGSERGFASLMTRQARALGMNHTYYNNPSGLPDDAQVTTARDMAILSHALIYHFPQYYRYFDTDSFTYNGVTHRNHNHLKSRYEGMDGIKTGYIRASGFNLAASARRDGVRLIGVVFGGRSTTARDNRMALLLDEGFAAERGQKTGYAMASNDADQGQGDSDAAPDTAHYTDLPPKTPPAAQGKPAATSREVAGGGGNPALADPMAESRWGIQVGAYSDALSGRRAMAGIVKLIPQLLGNAEPEIVKVLGDGGVIFYRARLMSLDQRSAETACAWLVNHQKGCLMVEP